MHRPSPSSSARAKRVHAQSSPLSELDSEKETDEEVIRAEPPHVLDSIAAADPAVQSVVVVRGLSSSDELDLGALAARVRATNATGLVVERVATTPAQLARLATGSLPVQHLTLTACGVRFDEASAQATLDAIERYAPSLRVLEFAEQASLEELLPLLTGMGARSELADLAVGCSSVEGFNSVWQRGSVTFVALSERKGWKKISHGARTALFDADALESLRVIDQPLTGELRTFVAFSLARHHTTLRDVCLIGAGLTDALSRVLASAIKSGAPALRMLVLARNDVGPTGARCLARAMRSCRCLEEASFAENPILDEGVRAVADDVVAHCESLVSLNLRRTGMSARGARAIARAIQSAAASLQYVDVESNQDERVEAIVSEALQARV